MFGGISRTDSRPTAETQPAITPRRAWPGRRALTGGLLVALACLGMFSALSDRRATEPQLYLVAKTDIGPETLVSQEHLAIASIDLPPSVAERAFRPDEQNAVVGAVSRASIATGELIQRSALGEPLSPERPSRSRQIAFRIDSARALDNRLRPGDGVDIVATRGAGAAAITEQILSGVRVVAIRTDANGLAVSGQLVVTVTLDDADQAVALVAAVDQGDITLVRAGP